MIAVVTELNKKKDSHKIKIERTEEIAIFRVGKKVGRLRLKSALLPYGDDVIFAPLVSTRGIVPLDTNDIKKELIFNLFLEFCFSQPMSNLIVGMVVDDMDFLERLIPVINEVESTVLVCEMNLEEFCKKCLVQTGTCPFVVQSKSYLYDCDVVFAFDGLVGFSGVLFGKGSKNTPFNSVILPQYCDRALELGVDFIELAAALRKYYL